MNNLLFALLSLIVLTGVLLAIRIKNVNLIGRKVWQLRTSFAQDWWIKITTDSPPCTYYFGPFETLKEARSLKNGYIEDLQSEGALIIASHIQWTQPENLTLEESY